MISYHFQLPVNKSVLNLDTNEYKLFPVTPKLK